jgi:hypothetical protein
MGGPSVLGIEQSRRVRREEGQSPALDSEGLDGAAAALQRAGAKSDFAGPLGEPYEAFESIEEPTRADPDSVPPEIVARKGEVLHRFDAPGHEVLSLIIRKADLTRGVFL